MTLQLIILGQILGHEEISNAQYTNHTLDLIFQTRWAASVFSNIHKLSKLTKKNIHKDYRPSGHIDERLLEIANPGLLKNPPTPGPGGN